MTTEIGHIAETVKKSLCFIITDHLEPQMYVLDFFTSESAR